jgi:hypothetical protein
MPPSASGMSLLRSRASLRQPGRLGVETLGFADRPRGRGALVGGGDPCSRLTCRCRGARRACTPASWPGEPSSARGPAPSRSTVACDTSWGRERGTPNSRGPRGRPHESLLDFAWARELGARELNGTPVLRRSRRLFDPPAGPSPLGFRIASLDVRWRTFPKGAMLGPPG